MQTMTTSTAIGNNAAGKQAIHPDNYRFLQDYIYRETRYRMLTASDPEAAKVLLAEAQEDVAQRWRMIEHLSKLDPSAAAPAAAAAPAQGGAV